MPRTLASSVNRPHQTCNFTLSTLIGLSMHSLLSLTQCSNTCMDDLDRYNSLDNGVCIKIHDSPWKCFYIDQIVIAGPMNFLCDPVVYSGELALAISNMDDNLYTASASDIFCNPDSLHGEGKTYWNATSVSTDHTKYLQFEFYFLNKSSCVFLNNRALSSVPIIQVTTFAICPSCWLQHHQKWTL